MGLSSGEYRSRFRSIARYVDFKLPKRLTPAIKAKVTRYHARIAKALAKGYKPVRTKADGRAQAANRLQGIKGMPSLTVAWVRPAGQGFEATITRDGSIKSTNRASGISKVTLACRFFDAEDDEGAITAEANRLRRAAREALGHKPQRCAVAYWGGENAWSDPAMLEGLLMLPTTGASSTPGAFPADGVSFYWVKRSKKILEVQQRLRDERRAAAEKRAERRRRSDV